METIKATRTYLEIVKFELIESYKKKIEQANSIDNLRVELAVNCPPSFYLYLYRQVGYAYYWRSKLSWTDEQIIDYLARSNISLWILYCAGVPAGYFEFIQHDDSSCEITYLGLIKEFMNKGLGKLLLVNAIEKARKKCNRVWLGTSTLDHPKALSNYIDFGFEQFKQEEYIVKIKDSS